MMNKARSTARPGRPKREAHDDVRKRLLEAARALFSRYGLRGVSGRQVADAAGVNAAMIRYYFGGKHGLYTAMLNEYTAPLIMAVSSSTTAPTSVFDLVERHARMLAANPWVAGVVLREVLPREGAFRPQFVKEFAGRIEPLVAQLVRRGIATGEFRPSLDPRLATLTLMSIVAFPFVADSVVKEVFGSVREPKNFERWIAHTMKLLRLAFANNMSHARA